MPKSPKEYPDYDSHSPSPSGVKALYTYLDQHYSVKRWAYTPELLAGQGNHHLLVMVGPFSIPEKSEMNGYESFMKKGNTLLLLKSNPGGMFGVNTEPVTKETADPDRITDNEGHHYQVEDNSPVRIRTKKGDQVLYHDKAGAIAIKRPVGKGTLIVANSPEWVTNHHITKQDHLPLVLSLLKTGSVDRQPVLFDEHSREGSHSVLLTVYPKWLLVFGFQAILLAILLLWHQGKRFGPVLSVREDTVRFRDERIKALAAWYQRDKKYRDSLALQADYVKALMLERWGISYRKSWQDNTDQLEKRWKNLSYDEIRSFTYGLTNVLRKEQVNKQEYLLWSKRLDRLRKEVEQG